MIAILGRTGLSPDAALGAIAEAKLTAFIRTDLPEPGVPTIRVTQVFCLDEPG